MARLVARHVWLGRDRWLSPGLLEWDQGGQFLRVRRARAGTPCRDLAVFPGLVDAHVHLQLLPLAARRPRSFPDWLRAVMRQHRPATPAERVARAVAALRQLAGDGTTAVGEIDASGESPRALQKVPLTGRTYRELTGFHLDAHAARALCRDRATRDNGVARVGWSPHAPYSVSPALFAAAAATRRHLAVHTAEVEAEQRFLHTGKGPLADLLRELGRLPADFRAPRQGAVRWLERLGVLRPTTQLVHCQELERGDAQRIAHSGASIAVCPGTIDWFARTPPPVHRWLQLGIPVALGTDSRASNDSWSMRAELMRAARLWPMLDEQTLLAMATTHGGRSLGIANAGRLRAGGRVDMFAVAAGSLPPAALLLEVVHGVRPTLHTWLLGRRVGPGGAAHLRPLAAGAASP